jgi:hypothetical protein
MMDDWDQESEDRWLQETWEAEHIWNIYVGKFKRILQLIFVAIIVFLVEAFIIGAAIVLFDAGVAYKI